MLALRQPRFRAAQVTIRSGPSVRFTILFTSFADARVKFVVNRIALGLADFLQNHLLGSLRGDAAEHIGRLGSGNLAAHFHFGILFASISRGKSSRKGSVTSSTTV